MATLSFLNDNIHLVAIVPDGPAQGYWFGNDRAAAENWARERNGIGENVYFTVNIVRPGLNAKPHKSDIVAARFFHVDQDDTQDPTALRHLGASIIINSGNGLQGLWNVQDNAAPHIVEEINRRIAHAIDADHCHNIDRLLRVPGTVNWPSRVKQARGKVATMASLLQPDSGTRYVSDAMLACFAEVPRPEALGEGVVGEWVPTLLTDMQPPLDVRLMQMCTTVMPEGQRSEYVSKCVKALGGAGYTNEQIMGLLLHPDNIGLSGTIFANRDPVRQAKRKLPLADKARIDPAAAFAAPPATTAPMLSEPLVVSRARDAGAEARDGGNGGIMIADQQLEHFKGCIYVTNRDKVMTPRGMMLGPSQFGVEYGGFSFTIDVTGEKVTKSAWEAFTINQRYKPPIVDDVCFRPRIPSREIITENGQKLVNMYVPIDRKTVDGDPAPFLNHVFKLLPDFRDAEILLTYMASCVQNPGVKFQWWPVIQGVQGNGKTVFLRVMEYAIGERYCHRPNAGKLTRKGVDFSGWVSGKLFLGLEEIFSYNRRDFLEEFKPFVTNNRLPIEHKGVDEYTGDNYANGMMLTNHKEGVPISADERRYCPLFTAQQSREDMERDGLTSEYFVKFFNWLNGDGLAIISHFLHTMPLRAEIDPAQLATRAPRSSCMSEALTIGRGRIEQEIAEAIETEKPGFCGGWISSAMVHKLLASERLSLPRNQYHVVMRNLGYIKHPELPDGRAPIATEIDKSRPRLWVKKGHLSIGNGITSLGLAQMYMKAQNKAIEELTAARFNPQAT